MNARSLPMIPYHHASTSFVSNAVQNYSHFVPDFQRRLFLVLCARMEKETVFSCYNKQ